MKGNLENRIYDTHLPDPIATKHYKRNMEDLSKEEFGEILRKYRLKEASEEEVRLIHSYYEVFEVKPDQLGSLSEEEQNVIGKEIKEGLDLQLAFQEGIADKKRRTRSVFRWVAAASVAALVISGVFMLRETETKKQQVSVVTPKAPVAKKNNLVQLPDGSTVILSADSKIDYPTSFDGHSERVVYLTGQAYFDIKHNPAKPFIVHTGNLVTTVLGTAFNIRALPGEKSITVTVTRGKVKVGDDKRTFSVLLPEQQIVYSIPDNEAVKESVNAGKVVEWKEDDLYFDDITISTAAGILEERFGTHIDVQNEQLRNQRFTTTFGKNETLESILASITTFANASYEISPDKKQITLSPK